MKKYHCRSPKGYCKSCTPKLGYPRGEVLDSLDDRVRDFIKYHSTPKYKEHIEAAVNALKAI